MTGNTMRPIPQAAIDFVALHEAVRLVSYRDPAGIWTIGYGHTGPEVNADMAWTQDQAKSALAADLSTARARLYGVVKPESIDPLTDNQYSALISFVFNLGAKDDWTIWKRMNAKQYDQVPIEMMRFVYAGSTKIQGLVNRRGAEVALWSTQEPGSLAVNPPSGFTRSESTPPVTSMPVSLMKQPAFVATGFAIALASPQAISQLTQQLTQYQTVPYVAHILSILATISPIAGAIAAGVMAYEKSQASH